VKNGTSETTTPSFLAGKVRIGLKVKRKTDVTPASNTKTENFGFSVKRFATTFPAVPP
jgi:hypothetical protein